MSKDGKITEVVSQAESHLLGMAVRGAITLPNITGDEAAALLTGLDVKSLPEYSGNAPFSNAGAQARTEATPQTPPPGRFNPTPTTLPGGIFGGAHGNQPTQPKPVPSPPKHGGQSNNGDGGRAFDPPTVPRHRHRHQPTTRIRGGKR